MVTVKPIGQAPQSNAWIHEVDMPRIERSLRAKRIPMSTQFYCAAIDAAIDHDIRLIDFDEFIVLYSMGSEL